MKKQSILLAAVFACSGVSLADYGRGSSHSNSSGTSSVPAQDSSNATYDSTIGNSTRQGTNQDMNKKARQSRSTTDGRAQGELDRGPAGTDSSGQKTDQTIRPDGVRE